MSDREPSREVYEKMTAEQDQFREWLLAQPPEKILMRAYEYAIREDLLMAMENVVLKRGQAASLLAVHPLMDNLFQAYEHLETGHMETVRNCLERYAGDLLRSQKELPVYRYSAQYANEHGELEAYRKSRTTNIACKEAIEEAIARHYHDNRLGSEAVMQVVEQFGYERPLYVLSVTVREKEGDGRISRSNKDWAKRVPVVDENDAWGGSRNCQLVVDRCNPCLTDIFIDLIRREYQLTLPLTKEEIVQEAGRILKSIQQLREPNSPEGTHFITLISPSFLARGNSRDMDSLMLMLPFSTKEFTDLPGLDGFYVAVPKNVNRNLLLR